MGVHWLPNSYCKSLGMEVFKIKLKQSMKRLGIQTRLSILLASYVKITPLSSILSQPIQGPLFFPFYGKVLFSGGGLWAPWLATLGTTTNARIPTSIRATATVIMAATAA